jgi:D-tyrosyl-tRNA(Tyr) deacylase
LRVVVQRVNSASVTVDEKIVGKINHGYMLLVGFTYGDTIDNILAMVKKIVNLRIMDDLNGVMNLSILDTGGEILSISQFTLYADTKKGNRPSYINAMKGEESTKLYDLFNEEMRKYCKVETGIFGADMTVEITNIGPTTILLER